jgi:hypothetical protein
MPATRKMDFKYFIKMVFRKGWSLYYQTFVFMKRLPGLADFYRK